MIDKIIPNNKLYENADVIGIALNKTEAARVKRVIDIVNSLNVNSVLDIGCGDGRITNLLNCNFVIGTDFSVSALKLVERNKVVSILPELPFATGSFDLVLCTEVLEHLDEDVYIKTLNEIKRIAKTYILLTCPLNERLIAHNTICLHCNHVFNMYHHIRSFDKREIERMDKELNGYQAILKEEVGNRVNYLPDFYYKIAQKKLKNYAYWSGCVCPACGKKNEKNIVDPLNVIQKGHLCLRLIKRIWSIARPLRHRWHFIRVYRKIT